MSANKLILVGRVGNDPEIRQVGNDKVANFSLATSETWKDKNGEKQEETEWHNIVIWRGLAEVVEKYVKKGQLLYLEGRIKTRKWQDKEGNDRYTTDIICNQMQMLGGKSDSESPSQSKPSSRADADERDDLPF